VPRRKPPRRPSGADKKQKPAKKEGGQGRSRNRTGADGVGRSTLNSILFAANQHCQTLESWESSAKTVDGSLPRAPLRAVLDEKDLKLQCQKMVSWADLGWPRGHPHPTRQQLGTIVQAGGAQQWRAKAATTGNAFPTTRSLHRTPIWWRSTHPHAPSWEPTPIWNT
jgi:hypothetical protein